MATSTQYNPNAALNATLLKCGASKTVYALVSPLTEAAKTAMLGSGHGAGQDADRAAYLSMFRGAWTGKQDALHEEFFDTWVDWSERVVNFNRSDFPFYYPTAGASEALRHIIYDFALRNKGTMLPPLLHIFEGEYEGYKAMAEAAGVQVMEWKRSEWTQLVERLNQGHLGWSHLVCISQPSAIDGNVWRPLNFMLDAIKMPNCVVMDVTYVGAIPNIDTRINLTSKAIRNVVFSLSKPFGCYYDRIGGVWFREEDAGLFGNKWFKNLTSLALGTALMKANDVFALPRAYGKLQDEAAESVSQDLGIELIPSQVYILATSDGTPIDPNDSRYDPAMVAYLRRPATGPVRVCLTPLMAELLGTAK